MSEPLRPSDLDCDAVREIAGAFVLGALDPDEEAAVRAHLASCPDAHAEIAEVGAMLPVLDASVPQVEPPEGLKGRILAAAAADSIVVPFPAEVSGPVADSARAEISRPVPATTPIALSPDRARGASPTRLDQRRTAVGWALRIAAVIVVGVLAGWNLLLQQQLGVAKTYEQNVAAVLEVASREGSLTAVLTAADGIGPAGIAAVTADGTMVVALRDLPATTGADVYEAWMIGEDAVPVALGGVQVGPSGIAYFEGRGLPTAPGITVAFTHEKGPGQTVPGGPVVVTGTTTIPG